MKNSITDDSSSEPPTWISLLGQAVLTDEEQLISEKFSAKLNESSLCSGEREDGAPRRSYAAGRA